mmetsp:Transcript_22678/g.55950  ORF Transcript_22678/g.55950 Transcript_22678/m.55950 type:complete len:189 (-) Transcript_22678:789-1355(-)
METQTDRQTDVIRPTFTQHQRAVADRQLCSSAIPVNARSVHTINRQSKSNRRSDEPLSDEHLLPAPFVTPAHILRRDIQPSNPPTNQQTHLQPSPQLPFSPRPSPYYVHTYYGRRRGAPRRPVWEMPRANARSATPATLSWCVLITGTSPGRWEGRMLGYCTTVGRCTGSHTTSAPAARSSLCSLCCM